MPRKRVNKSKKVALPILNPEAAGIDIGTTEIYVAGSADRNPEPIRMFATFTQDLSELADWLQQCRIRTVAMESTGVYWIPLMQILETRGLEVYLVNSKHVKNVPGRRTDVSDFQWLQYLQLTRLIYLMVSQSVLATLPGRGRVSIDELDHSACCLHRVSKCTLCPSHNRKKL
jgi:hypothetical protein